MAIHLPPKRHQYKSYKPCWSDDGSKATLKHSSCIDSPSTCPLSTGVTTIRDLLHCSTALNPLTFPPGSHGRTQAKALVGKKHSPVSIFCNTKVSRRSRKGPLTHIYPDQGGVVPNQRLSYSQAHSSLAVTALRRSATSALMGLCPTGDKLHEI